MVSHLQPRKGTSSTQDQAATAIRLCIGNFTTSSRTPSHLTPDPAFFFPNPHHEDALATLIDSLHTHRGMGAILGAAGLGKTLLLHVYLTLARQRQYKTIYVPYTDLAFRTLLQVLYQALELDLATATLDMFLAACQQHSVILGIDDAHLMPTVTLKKLWTLTEYAASAGAILHIVLAGHPELNPKLDALALHHLTPESRGTLYSLTFHAKGEQSLHLPPPGSSHHSGRNRLHLQGTDTDYQGSPRRPWDLERSVYECTYRRLLGAAETRVC